MGLCFGKPINALSTTKTLRPTKPGDERTPDQETSKDSLQNSGSESVAAKRANNSLRNDWTTLVSPNLKRFTFAELRSATRNFRSDTVLGEGGFGTVFKGWVDETTLAPSKVGVGMAVAVKKSNPDSPQGLHEWQSEVKFLGKFSHPHLVRLIGYCSDEKQFLLVYEYMPKGSLENHLFRKGTEPLSWETRLKIAIEAARGLAFLHDSENHVIYRDFKTSNILLDWDYTAKLSDFGLAKLGPSSGYSHVTTRKIGTYGYAAPEYIATGHLYLKSDVYGFGVVLLEMLTGRVVLDMNRPSGEHNLVDWARPYLPDKRNIKKIIDPKLGDHYPKKGAIEIAQLILKCLEGEPKNRSSMEEVLMTLEHISTIQVSNRQEQQPDHPQHHGSNRSPLHFRHGAPENHHRHHHDRNRSPLHHRPGASDRSPLHQRHGDNYRVGVQAHYG
ncbi:Serine-threonine/tyrosine-protein kinase, catalytic domain [Dillenia turbinata]|uniref:non-specific serine/threonine protein kinase n=1 Tax=Dillenia turbinata TaxID=194707 RepID=A0AAN8VS41_9MAGN